MSKGLELADAGCKYIGVPYSKLDCQAFVEKALADIGIRKNLPGSNAWYREVIKNGWMGSPEECRKKYGKIPQGAFLFIVAHDGKEPSKYREDGYGNASHIGIYTGMTGREMCNAAGVSVKEYDFGNGAIHSSQSRGFVCPSNFNGKSISGGWNMVGLYNPVMEGGGKMVEYEARVVGGNLNMREEPTKYSDRLCQIPDGTILKITEEHGEWALTSYSGNVGWVMKTYLESVDDTPNEKVEVPRRELEEMLNLIDKWLKG
jgi:hypothetical protein